VEASRSSVGSMSGVCRSSVCVISVNYPVKYRSNTVICRVSVNGNSLATE